MRTPFEYFVKARRESPPHEQVAEGYQEAEQARPVAKRLAQDVAYSDVLVIRRELQTWYVSVLKGVHWFCETQLDVQFPGWVMDNNVDWWNEEASEVA